MTHSAAAGPRRYTIGPGIVMMRQGERADRAWLIESGELEVLLTAPDGGTRRLGGGRQGGRGRRDGPDRRWGAQRHRALADLIQSGRVALRPGHGTLGGDIATFGPGSLFGEIYLLTGRKPDVTAVAVAGGICEVIDKRSFEDAVTAMPPILKSLARIYIAQLTKAKAG